ncbi:MAG: phosphatase PAP2 family protein [Saprospiraceae bacterium]|nr:phosphatase PAP2 family protein [Saprospiraceae bacterium]
MLTDIILEWDKSLFSLINGQWHNNIFDLIMPYIRDKKTWIPLYLLLLFFIGKKRGIKTVWVLIIITITIIISDQISSELVKKSICRIRPCNDTTLNNVRLLLENCGGGFSFTSSHATNHFSFAMQLYLIFRCSWNRIYFLLLFIWACLIAYGQIYVGVHFPLDVIGGAFLGCFLAFIVNRICSWLGLVKRIWT